MKKAGLFIFLVPFVLLAQTEITGGITDSNTGEPLAGSNVFVDALNVGAATDAEGNYSFVIPAAQVRGQEVKVTVRYIGYKQATTTITLTPGSITQDFVLEQDVLGMEEIVVTGVVDETPLTKVPFAVGRISGDDLEVPAVSAESAIRGKISGVKVIKATGAPGSAASVQLRGATSINASGRSQEPLYIVDGVILGSTLGDIDALDIESIEVVKGAAGASLYGSRAAQGVVRINTMRGKNLPVNKTRFHFRTENGTNTLPKRMNLVQNHTYKLAETSYTDENGNAVTSGDFIDDDGNWVDPRDPQGGRATNWFGDPANGIVFQDGEYKWVATGEPSLDDDGTPNQQNMPTRLPGGGFNQFERFFTGQSFRTTSLSMSRNSPTTNFFASFARSQEPGPIRYVDGNVRNSLRVNLDHSIAEGLELSVSTYYAQSNIEPLGGGIIFDFMFMPPDVDLELVDENDYEREFLGNRWDPKLGDDAEIFVMPDPTNTEEANPLYGLLYRDYKQTRNRFLTNTRLSYRPFNWFGLEANLSLDRYEFAGKHYRPKDYKTINASSTYNFGYLDKDHNFDEAVNADVTASFYHSMGDLNLRAKLRYLYEQDKFASTSAEGFKMAVKGVESLNVASNKNIESEQETILADGRYFIGGLDYAGKYLGEFMFRSDGVSLFGPEQRRQSYYRVSGAYRLSEEAFWSPFRNMVNEFKLRFSQGTAGNRPSFAAQYETYDVSGGFVSKENLGNKLLKPEFSTETEFGLDAAFLNRVSLQLTKAKSVTEDQILLVPLVGYFGFGQQWQNVGTLEANTWEVSLEALLLQRGILSWSANLVFDKTTQVITEFNLPEYTWAPPGSQDMLTYYNREGETFGDMYGWRWITTLGELPSDATKSEFQKNDDGYVVWVGAGQDYTDGITDSLWGTSSTDGAYKWGIPIAYYDEEEETYFTKLGSSVPDLSYGFSSTLRLGDISLYALFEGQRGGHIYNMTSQWGMRDYKDHDVDQAGKPDGKKKPAVYYDQLYQVRDPSSHFVEDGTYLKLQELSMRYSFSIPQFENRITAGVIGRNLLAWSDYSGFDPEVGVTGGEGGSAVVTRFDNFSYPNFRSYSLVLEVEL